MAIGVRGKPGPAQLAARALPLDKAPPLLYGRALN
jgi:hypothetical protein